MSSSGIDSSNHEEESSLMDWLRASNAICTSVLISLGAEFRLIGVLVVGGLMLGSLVLVEGGLALTSLWMLGLDLVVEVVLMMRVVEVVVLVLVFGPFKS